MEGMVEVDDDNIFGLFNWLVFICAKALDDNVPTLPLHQVQHYIYLWLGVPFIVQVIWQSSFFIFLDY